MVDVEGDDLPGAQAEHSHHRQSDGVAVVVRVRGGIPGPVAQQRLGLLHVQRGALHPQLPAVLGLHLGSAHGGDGGPGLVDDVVEEPRERPAHPQGGAGGLRLGIGLGHPPARILDILARRRLAAVVGGVRVGQQGVVHIGAGHRLGGVLIGPGEELEEPVQVHGVVVHGRRGHPPDQRLLPARLQVALHRIAQRDLGRCWRQGHGKSLVSRGAASEAGGVS